MKRTFAALPLLLAVLTGCNRSAPANVAATVNGRAITYAELRNNFNRSLAPRTSPSGDQSMIQKQRCARWPERIASARRKLG
jgi:hypothetical protein